METNKITKMLHDCECVAGKIDLDAKVDASVLKSVKEGNLDTFTDVYFPVPFPKGSNVIVIPMVQTFNGADTPGVRIANVTATGFKIRMNELIVHDPAFHALSDVGHLTETIGWVAFSV